MASEDLQRTCCDFLLYFLALILAFFGISIISYAISEENGMHKAGLETMMDALGIVKQIHLYFTTGALCLFVAAFCMYGLCLAPRWGCWYLLAILFLIASIAIDVYLFCILLSSDIHDWGVKAYLRSLDYSTTDGQLIWDNLQKNVRQL